MKIVSNFSSHIQYSFSAYSCVKEGRAKITTALTCHAFLSLSVTGRKVNVFFFFKLKIMILKNKGKCAKQSYLSKKRIKVSSKEFLFNNRNEDGNFETVE